MIKVGRSRRLTRERERERERRPLSLVVAMYERKGFFALLRRDPPRVQLRRLNEEGRRAGTPKPVYYSKRAVSARVKSSGASSRVRPRGVFYQVLFEVSFVPREKDARRANRPRRGSASSSADRISLDAIVIRPGEIAGLSLRS